MHFELSNWTIEPRTRKYVKEYGFLSFAMTYRKQLFDTGLGTLKTASKKVVHKTGVFSVNKITDAVTKSNDNKVIKQELIEQIIIPLKKRDEILKGLRQVLL